MQVSETSGRALRRGFSDSVLLGLGSLASAALGLVALRLLLTGLTQAQYGQYAVFLSLASLLTVFVTWPTHAVLRLGAEEWEARRSVGRTFASTLILVLGASVVVGGVTALFGARIDTWLEAPGLWPVAIAFATLTGLAQLGYTLLQPTERTGLRTLFPAVARAAQAGLLALVVLGSGASLTVFEAALLGTIAIVPAAVFSLLTVAGDLREPQRDPVLTRRALVFSSPLILRNLGAIAVLYVDVLVLEHLLGAAAAGRYHVAYVIAEQVVVFGFVLEFLAGPLLATAAARGEGDVLARYYRLAVPPLAWLWAIGAGLLLALAEPAMGLLGAKAPAASAVVLQLLCLAVAVRGVGLLETPALDAHLLSRWPTVFFVLGLLVNVTLDVVLITQAGWGIEACAVGTLAGFGLQGFLRAVYIGRVFRVAALRPYLAVAVPAVLWGTAQVAPWPVVLLAWVVVASAVLLIGRSRAVGLFPAETRARLAEVPLPSVVRRLVDLVFPA